jgi:hypothetical protein
MYVAGNFPFVLAVVCAAFLAALALGIPQRRGLAAHRQPAENIFAG